MLGLLDTVFDSHSQRVQDYCCENCGNVGFCTTFSSVSSIAERLICQKKSQVSWSKVTATFTAVTTSTRASHGNGLTLHSTFHSQIKGNNNSHIKFRPLCKEAL